MDTGILHRLESPTAGYFEIRIRKAVPLGTDNHLGRCMAEVFRNERPPVPRVCRTASTIRLFGKDSHQGWTRDPYSQVKRCRTSRHQFSRSRGAKAVRVQKIWCHAELCQPIPEALLPQLHPQLFRRVDTKPRM